MSLLITFVCFAILLLSSVEAYSVFTRSLAKVHNDFSSTALNAHHVNKKITKRMMDRRPKKSRPSDINRNNINLNKCITKVENAPAEYTIISAEDYMRVREKALKFWEDGDSSSQWLEITEEDMAVTFSQNRDPLPVGGVQKRPPLVRSGSR